MIRGQVEILGNDRYVYNHEQDDNFMSGCLFQTQCLVYTKYVQLFMCQSYLNRVDKKENTISGLMQQGSIGER